MYIRRTWSVSRLPQKHLERVMQKFWPHYKKKKLILEQYCIDIIRTHLFLGFVWFLVSLCCCCYCCLLRLLSFFRFIERLCFKLLKRLKEMTGRWCKELGEPGCVCLILFILNITIVLFVVITGLVFVQISVRKNKKEKKKRKTIQNCSSILWSSTQIGPECGNVHLMYIYKSRTISGNVLATEAADIRGEAQPRSYRTSWSEMNPSLSFV